MNEFVLSNFSFARFSFQLKERLYHLGNKTLLRTTWIWRKFKVLKKYFVNFKCKSLINFFKFRLIWIYLILRSTSKFENLKLKNKDKKREKNPYFLFVRIYVMCFARLRSFRRRDKSPWKSFLLFFYFFDATKAKELKRKGTD